MDMVGCLSDEEEGRRKRREEKRTAGMGREDSTEERIRCDFSFTFLSLLFY